MSLVDFVSYFYIFRLIDGVSVYNIFISWYLIRYSRSSSFVVFVSIYIFMGLLNAELSLLVIVCLGRGMLSHGPILSFSFEWIWEIVGVSHNAKAQERFWLVISVVILWVDLLRFEFLRMYLISRKVWIIWNLVNVLFNGWIFTTIDWSF